jgi:hypothetical protein
LRIIEALAQALGAEFRFNIGENGSESVQTFPVDQEGSEQPHFVRRAVDSAAHAF